MKRILLFIFLTLVASTSVFAQVINWQTAAGGSHQLFFYDMVLTPDSGFVVASELFSPVGNEVTDPPFGDTDYWIVKYS